MSIPDWQQRKAAGQAITMVTCYDATMAHWVREAGIDMILVGDSAAMVMHGHDSTLPINYEQMSVHVSAVRRGAPDAFIIGDMPFLSTRKGLAETMDAVGALMQAGANAIKVEGIAGQQELVSHIVESGVPVMGHLGLTPQSVNLFGGFKVQGRGEEAQQRILQAAQTCEKAGCFALVLECVPEPLGTAVTQAIGIPTIGIGAGNGTDGQVLVLQDLLGLSPGPSPKFVRRYLDGGALVTQALTRFREDVGSGNYPAASERYKS